MKKFIARSLMVMTISLTTVSISFGQFGSLGDILSSGADDASLMFKEYVRPVTTSLGANLNSGWYNTAKVHGKLGFHITFTTSVALVPDEAKTYDLSTLGLNASFSENMAKTAMGEKGSGPRLTYYEHVPAPIDQDVEVASFEHPGGLGIGFLPSPMISAGIGLIKETEIDGRYMPTIKYGANKENTVDLWGIGFKHSLKQWIPIVSHVPVFQLSLQYGYTNLKWHTDFNPLTPESFNADDETNGAYDWNSQSMDFKTTAQTVNLLVGANLPVVCFYGGAGLSISKSTLVTNGFYPIPEIAVDPVPRKVVTSALENPLDLEIAGGKEDSNISPRLNLGVRFKFAVITIHFDYTYAYYSVATAGLGIAWR